MQRRPQARPEGARGVVRHFPCVTLFVLLRDLDVLPLLVLRHGVPAGTAFADDLGADSLALIELVEALEEELSERSVGFRIDDDDLEDLRTVRDAVDYVVSRFN